jgi:hypothetical protein
MDKKVAYEIVDTIVAESEGVRGTMTAGLTLITEALVEKGFKFEDIKPLGCNYMLGVTKLLSMEQLLEGVSDPPKHLITEEQHDKIVKALVSESPSFAGTVAVGMALLSIALEHKGLNHEDIEPLVFEFNDGITEIATKEQKILVIKDEMLGKLD